MQKSWSANIKTGHHAYLITGEEREIVPELLQFLKKEWEIKIEGNPDITIKNYPTLYIEDFHDLEKSAINKALGNDPKLFIISFGFMTREAANAMLKLFEEPTSTTFFVITTNPERLPNTLRSRFFIVNSSRKTPQEAREEAEQFIKMNIGKRFEYSKKFASDISEEKRTRQEALALVEAIEETLREKSSVTQKTPQFADLEKCRSYLKDQSSSVKILLDQIALSLAEF